MSDRPDYLIPAALARWPLYAPLAPLLEASGERLPGLVALNRLVAEAAPALKSPSGEALRFVAPDGIGADYEQAVFDGGLVATRTDNWHDYFNALVWAVFPRTKAALNVRHMQEIALSGATRSRGRGPVRDALTQFDECGLLVIGTDASLLAALAGHDWRSAFWDARARLKATTRFLMFGHASYDQMRTPFNGLCAKALYVSVPESVLHMPLTGQLAWADAWLATEVAERGLLSATRDLSALPLLGIPGVVRENAVADFYHDASHFRPLGDRAPAAVISCPEAAALAL
ncbi:DUF3025 domain-containing protein [Denitromonas iodatirespirans]|uniref:DUF3025 domain-containing protein n=1 Tax=Denitromonas iodatirespirans TaxID=2795389 RepID=A0A944DBR8_DENI1|nr:DUF3025 domain-containing protein [Denitromonas iodatirespirans]MBT0962502.1 DUF3025 domain-containing protein [Denitromonas iodatirespirans]